VPWRSGAAGRRPWPPGAQASRPVQAAAPRGSPPGAVRQAVPGADPSPHATEGAHQAMGAARADQSRHPWVGTRRSPGGCATALPPAGQVDRAPHRLVPGSALAESEVAPVSDPTPECGVRSRATDPSHPRSRSLMTPERSSGGQRRAGKLHEPCDRADGGRATPLDLRRLYTQRLGKPATGGRATASWQPSSNPAGWKGLGILADASRTRNGL
jgi:hypothetical protein